MRRSSVARLQSQNSEPQIVIEENEGDQDDETQKTSSSQQSSEAASPTMNPYLLSPYTRDVRKLSLPSPQCSGITASQVRRLSERGETGPGPRQAEFLATLSTAPQVSPGGRRHSVVTISKLPSGIFGGKSRRESVAAFPTAGLPSRILPNRRESIACPPSNESRGSIHNLQLDIMDDIVQARKVRMKVWNTSNEKLCEVQPLDEASGSIVQRYTNAGRRFSDFVGTTLAPIPSSSKRRQSELPPPPSTRKQKSKGIVCTNTDLKSILSSLSTSAMEINQWDKEETTKPPKLPQTKIVRSKSELKLETKDNRSKSFDLSVLQGIELPSFSGDFSMATITSPSSWFANRHQPKTSAETSKKSGTFADLKRKKTKEPGKVLWDEQRGSLVDPHTLGSAIEGFLKQSTPDSPTTKETMASLGSKLAGKVMGAANRVKSGWFSKTEEDASTEHCETSLCSQLKDLFVK